MRILIACEESQTVCKSFRERGHEAYSCDVQKCSGGRPEWHIQDDVLKHLDAGWDLLIAHPPCTRLCRNSAKWNTEKVKPDISLFMALLNADIPKICIENPVPAKLTGLPPYTQIIQPYEHGHDYSKKTCLWLKNLPPLVPTKIVELTYVTTASGKRYTAGWYRTPRTGYHRSKTFPGIAAAMSSQWS